MTTRRPPMSLRDIPLVELEDALESLPDKRSVYAKALAEIIAERRAAECTPSPTEQPHAD